MAQFDGSCLYEHKDPRQGAHPHWGTLIYNYGRPGVSNFLIANAMFWADRYHADGIRFDAVASMLYLDYGKNPGEWIANMYGGHENLEAVEFLKHLNSVFRGRKDGAILIAEESTAWPKVTGDVKNGGLGFDYKWNMGWMNDFLGYMEQDPYFRCHHYNELTFSMIYAYSENFVLVFSHDEVVHGKGSLVNKMPGQTFEDKFANLRAAYGFMMGHPGKKLLFMGQDFAQMDEWNENASIEWELLQYPIHSQMKEYVKELNHFYTSHPALYQKDYQTEGFEWINCMDAADNIIAFLRRGADETLLFVCNFAPQLHEKLTVGVPFKGKYKEIFNSDAEKFGGSGKVNPRMKSSKAEECDGKENSITIQLAPLGISVFNCTPTEPEKKEKPAKAKKTTHSTKSVKEKAETDLQSMMTDAAAAFNGKAGGQLLRQQNAWRVFQISWQRRRRGFPPRLSVCPRLRDDRRDWKKVWIKGGKRVSTGRNEIDGNSGRADRRGDRGGSRVTIGSGKFERGYDGCDHAPDWPGAYGIGTEGTWWRFHHFPDWTKVISMIEKMLSARWSMPVWMWV